MKLRITIAGSTYEAEVEILEEDEGAAPYLPPPPPAYSAIAANVRNGNLPPGGNDHASGGVCLSPVTGHVIRIDVDPGQAVEANQVLIVLEAMKMETQVTAPRAGTVQKVHVAAGNSVKANQPLIELE